MLKPQIQFPVLKEQIQEDIYFVSGSKYVRLAMYWYVHINTGAQRGQNRAPDTMKLELQEVVSYLPWALGTEYMLFTMEHTLSLVLFSSHPDTVSLHMVSFCVDLSPPPLHTASLIFFL